jgi:ABC-type multidrug transport system ATPase subunit
VIRARDLHRRFGDKRVIVGLDLAVAEGELLLLTGPNGSGKSTLLALLAGLLAPTKGSLEVRAGRRELGFLAHEPLVYRQLTAMENLELYGRLYRIPERRERIGMLLERFGLWEDRHGRVDEFSHGMLQRLAFCRTLLHDPRLLLLDEPYSGLDSDGAAVVDSELAELARTRTLVVSSHDPERLAPLATQRLALA